MYQSFGYVRCTLCQQVYQNNIDHNCPVERQEAEIASIGYEVEGYLTHSNEAKFLTYLAERGKI